MNTEEKKAVCHDRQLLAMTELAVVKLAFIKSTFNFSCQTVLSQIFIMVSDHTI